MIAASSWERGGGGGGVRWRRFVIYCGRRARSWSVYSFVCVWGGGGESISKLVPTPLHVSALEKAAQCRPKRPSLSVREHNSSMVEKQNPR